MYACSICKKGFGDTNGLRKHFVDSHHLSGKINPELTDFRYSCTACGRNFLERSELLRHLRNTKCSKKQFTTDCYELQEKITEIPSQEENSECDNKTDHEACGVEMAPLLVNVESTGIKTPCQMTDNEMRSTCTESNSHLGESSARGVVGFLCELLSNKKLNRQLAFEIFLLARDCFLEPVVEVARRSDGNNNCLTEILAIIEQLHSTSCSINTEHKLRKYLKKIGCYADPVEHVIETTVQNVIEKSELRLREINESVTVPDILIALKLFLSLPKVLVSILDYQDKIKNSNRNVNFMNGDIWKEIGGKDPRKNLIPVYLYFDDFVVDNQISHRRGNTSYAGFYLLFPTLPPEHRSQVQNMLLIALIKTASVKEYGFGRNLEPVINQLIKIEKSGLEINIEGLTYVVHVCVVQIIGDNKGLNEILGYVRSFNASHFCRLCTCGQPETRVLCKELTAKLRNSVTYENDLRRNNSTETGLIERAAVNRLTYFKVFNNYATDVHHDMLQGGSLLVICKVLLHFVKNYFRLDQLNTARHSFVCESGSKNRNNIDISKENLEKAKLPFTASEARQFIMFLPGIIDHLVPNKNNDHWKLMLYTIQILELSLLPEHDEETVKKLKLLVFKHHTLYLKLGEELTPKLHFWTHYATTILKCGPVVHLSATRGESIHQDLKDRAGQIASRINLSKSICINDMYSLAGRHIKEYGLENRISFGKRKHLTELNSIERSILSDKLRNALSVCQLVDYFGIEVRTGDVLKQCIDGSENFFIVDKIIECRNEVLLLCYQLENVTFEEKLRFHRLINRSQNPVATIVNVADLQFYPAIISTAPSGKILFKIYRRLEKL